MGFFSDLKGDLSLSEKKGQAGKDGTAEGDVDLDRMLNHLDEVDLQKDAGTDQTGTEEDLPQPVFESQAEEEDRRREVSADQETEGDDFLSRLSQALNSNPSFEEEQDSARKGEETASVTVQETVLTPETGALQQTQNTYRQKEGGFMMEEQNGAAVTTDEDAVITAGMVVNGDISTTGNMELLGKVTGNVTVNGKLTISGEITGDSTAAEIYAESARINGEIHSKGSVKIGQSTVIIGNISANGAVVAGAVKGDIDVHGPVILDRTAIVMGNIRSQSVQVNNGAVIEGMCSQVYAEVNPSAFFDGLKEQ